MSLRQDLKNNKIKCKFPLKPTVFFFLISSCFFMFALTNLGHTTTSPQKPHGKVVP